MLFIYPYLQVGEDMELRLSMRSVVKNFPGKNHEFLIVGSRPRNLKIDSYFFIPGNMMRNKFANVAHNVLLGAQWALANGYKNAVIMNDDFLITKKLTLKDSKSTFVRAMTYKDYVEKVRGDHDWCYSNQKTLRYLRSIDTDRAETMPCFETHTFLFIDTRLMVDALAKHDWTSKEILQWRSLYGFEAKPKTVVPIIDPKVRPGVREPVYDGKFFSLSDEKNIDAQLIRYSEEFEPLPFESQEFVKKVAVAVSSTGTRPESLNKTITAFMCFKPDYFTVNFDLNREGVAATKNRGIKWFLEETDADYLMLVDDDFRPKVNNFLEEYKRVAFIHNLPHITGVYREAVKAEVKDGLQYGTWASGCVLFLSREAVERVGYMRLEFGKFGHEHVEYSKRVANFYPESYPAETPYVDIENSIRLWSGEDFDSNGSLKRLSERSSTSTVAAEDRNFAGDVFDKYKNIVEYVPYEVPESKPKKLVVPELKNTVNRKENAYMTMREKVRQEILQRELNNANIPIR